MSLNNQLAQAGVIKELPTDNLSNWIRGGEDGWLYPPQARVIPVLLKNKSTAYAVIDETGFNGYEEVENRLVRICLTEKKAWDVAKTITSPYLD